MGLPPVLVLSSGRCGSTLISEMLNLHPEILSLSEFFTTLGAAAFSSKMLDGPHMWRILSEQTPFLHAMLADGIVVDEARYPFDAPGARFRPDNVPPIMSVALPHLTPDHETLFDELQALICARPKAPLAEQYRFLFETLQRKFHRRIWVERSGGSLLVATSLLKLFPDAQVIHVYRDGRDTALSMSRHHNFRIMMAVVQKLKRVGIDATQTWNQGTIGPGQLWAERLLFRFIDHHKLLKREVPLSEFGWLWSHMIESGCDVLAQLPAERVLSMSFEQLQQTPRACLTELIRFIDPSLENAEWLAQAERMPTQARSKYLDLPADQLKALTTACAPGLTRLGYPL